MLIPLVILSQTASNSYLVTTDTTGFYSLGNPGGWDFNNFSLNNSNFDVASVYISGTITTPGNSVTTISSTELMPTGQYPLPYAIGQQFVLTPAMLGLTSTTFPDGLYSITYTINISLLVMLVASSAGFSNGDVVNNVSQTKRIGRISNITGNYITIIGYNGWLPVNSNTINNGTATTTITSFVFTPTTPFVVTTQSLITPNADACIANLLAQMEPCNCDCSPTSELFNVFMTLMAAKAAAANFCCNRALDDLQIVVNYCSQSGCPCNC